MPDSSHSALELLQPAPEGWQWVVLHARPRCEKKIEGLARQREARFFLPCVDRVHNYGGRVRTNRVPMFPGYIFGLIRREDRLWFRQSQYVANLLEVLNENRLIEALRAVAVALEEEIPLDVLPFLQSGTRVCIIGGPMKGLEAVIAEVKGRHQVILQLDLIQQSVALEIDAAFLKAVE